MKRWNQRPYETPAERQERELVAGQRRRLEALVQRQTRSESQERLTELMASHLSPADLAALEDLLTQTSAADLPLLLSALCEQIQARFGSDSAVPQAALLSLLRLLARFGHGPGESGGRRRNPLSLSGLELQGASLAGLDFSGIELRDITLEASQLQGVKFFGARLEHLKLAQARLDQVDLTGAILRHSDLRGANLRSAKLISAEVEACDLRHADLRGASLRGLRLVGCDLRGADLSETQGLGSKQLYTSRIDAQTRLPEILRDRQAELMARSAALNRT